MKKMLFGIIVCYTKSDPPFMERSFFFHISKAALRFDINLIIFDPRHINWESRQIKGWYLSKELLWCKKTTRIPDIIYDRCFYLSASQYVQYKPYVQKILTDPLVTPLGIGLSGKIQNHNILINHPLLKCYLPETKILKSYKDLVKFSEKHNKFIIKPNGGSQGIGVMRIEKIHNSVVKIKGRNLHNQNFERTIANSEDFKEWINGILKGKNYLIQEYLNLNTKKHNKPFDLRIIMQKNRSLNWQTTGMAVRLGSHNSITSNLHGGGKAMPVQQFLKANFDPALNVNIDNQINIITKELPEFLERSHAPLVELGLDLGIDDNGKVWIIELNSKPGRNIFKQIKDLEVFKNSITLPLEYAVGLFERHKELTI